MTTAEPSDEEIVQVAAEAAEEAVFLRYKQSEVTDLDVTVTFEDGVLEIDIYLNAPESEEDPDEIVDEAARAGQAAVDELFADTETA